VTRLSANELTLLHEIIERWQPALLELLSRPSLTDEEREELRGALAEELVASGLNKADQEPNSYGLQIEDLIDKIGRIPSKSN
jgi:hypothetical protein